MLCRRIELPLDAQPSQADHRLIGRRSARPCDEEIASGNADRKRMGCRFASAQELRPPKNTTWGHSTHGDSAYAVYHVIPDDDGTAVRCQRQLRMRGVGPPGAWNARARRKRLTVSRRRIEDRFLGHSIANECGPHDMNHSGCLDSHRRTILWTSIQ